MQNIQCVRTQRKNKHLFLIILVFTIIAGIIVYYKHQSLLIWYYIYRLEIVQTREEEYNILTSLLYANIISEVTFFNKDGECVKLCAKNENDISKIPNDEDVLSMAIVFHNGVKINYKFLQGANLHHHFLFMNGCYGEDEK